MEVAHREDGYRRTVRCAGGVPCRRRAEVAARCAEVLAEKDDGSARRSASWREALRVAL
ncbi:MAG: hypothetical protein QOH55_2381 [Microbacteriaceae bacterium]|jgi:hypothetical protein|nr:hypothetical protein [Microbacteriaceae bacterium]